MVLADLTKEEETTALIGQASSALGPISCLINNASTFEYDDIHSVTRDSWDSHMEVNLRAPFVLSQKMAEQLPDDAEPSQIQRQHVHSGVV